MLLKGSSEPDWPRYHHDVLQQYYEQYDRQIASGKYQPFLYPWGTFGALVIIIYLLIPHHNRPWLKQCRYLMFAWITGFAAYTVLCTRARGMAPALGIGLLSAWSVVWCTAILICSDAEEDFMRIDRVGGLFGQDHSTRKGQASTSTLNSVKSTIGKEKPESMGQSSPSQVDINTHGHTKDPTAGTQYAWQTYPKTSFLERLDWVLDVFLNFRGAAWNWRTTAIPPPPKHIQLQLIHNTGPISIPQPSFRTHSSQPVPYPDRTTLLRASFKTFITGYILLDIIKTAITHDPYFWGQIAAPPPTYLPSALTSSPVLTHIYRMTLAMLSVKIVLETIFALGPLLFSGVIGPALLGARAEPFVYPPSWAPYAVVLDHGLAGWWSAWWHQTFRYGFEAPGRRLVQALELDSKSKAARIVKTGVAFGLSGMLHACGSWTCLGETRPVRGPMVFFVLQGVGVIGEAVLRQSEVAKRVGARLPGWVKKGWTFAYVHVWFYYTAHILCDDFARGGCWLFEPIPISVLRGLGLGGDEMDGWWCWGGELAWWHSGQSWWTTGIAF